MFRKRGTSSLKVLREGYAVRVIFYYPGEEGAFLENAQVTVYENGILYIQTRAEEITTHIHNCEVLWKLDDSSLQPVTKLELYKGKGDKLHGEKKPSTERATPDETIL